MDPTTISAQRTGQTLFGGLNPTQTNDPFAAGAEQRMGDVDDFLKGKGSPEAAQLLQLLQELIHLLVQLMMSGGGQDQAQPNAAPQGAQGAGKGGKARNGGGAKKGKGKVAKEGAQGAGDKGPTQKLDGPNGFLWKPVSDSDGKLAVLLPDKFKGQVANVEIQDANGNTLEKGRFSGDGNGNRPHFRFNKQGGAYGDNVRVVATLNDGRKVDWAIANTGVRND